MAELRSSLSELQQFAHSRVWIDLAGEMGAWLDDIRTQLETCTEPQTIAHLQGNVVAVRRFLELPQSLIELLEVDAQSSEIRRRRASE